MHDMDAERTRGSDRVVDLRDDDSRDKEVYGVIQRGDGAYGSAYKRSRLYRLR
jgi:hypothetical protein